MNKAMNTIKEELKSLKSIINKLKKYPGNSVYTENYFSQKLSLEKEMKTLFRILPKNNKGILNYENQINTIVKLFNEPRKNKEKIKAISEIFIILDGIDLEMHDEHVSQLLISKQLEQKMMNNFPVELEDLKLVYKRSGNCTAFILRKILEKSIFYAFANNNMINKIEDKDSPNKYHELNKLIKIASTNKIKGKPILNAKTAKNINGIKFLGDSAAHNYLINIDLEDIVPQMPFILIAIKELSLHFKSKA